MIRPYLRDITNDHKTKGEWDVPSGNTVIDYKTMRMENSVNNDNQFYIF